MARERDDDYADDDKRPPRRRDSDDDDGDRPARRRDRDDDDRASGRGGESGIPSGLDKYFGNLPISVTVAVIIGFCCACIPIILGGVGLATTKTPEGKKGATITLVIGVVWFIIGSILGATGVIDVKQFTK